MFDLPRIPMPTDATSAEIARFPVAIRRQALWSAKLNTIGPTVEIGNSVKEILDGKLSQTDARIRIRKALAEAGYTPPGGSTFDPTQEGNLLDHRSKKRIDLMVTHQVRKSRGYAYYASGMPAGR